MAYPKYVRLADHLTRGMRADINSGFSIGGFDVKESPNEDDYPDQASFVKREIAAGRLESASKAEFDEVHPDILGDLGIEVKRVMTVEGSGLQETHVQQAAMRGHRAVRAGRETVDEDAVEADEERRKALIEQANDQEKGKKRSRKAAGGAESGSGSGSEGSGEGSGSEGS